MARKNAAIESIATEAVESSSASVESFPIVTESVAVIAPSNAITATPVKTHKREVRAKVIFADALTGRNFRTGDIIEGWDDARIAHYAERGLVVVHSVVGPSEFK